MTGSVTLAEGRTQSGLPFYGLPDATPGKRVAFTASGEEPLLVCDERGRWLAFLQPGWRVTLDRVEDPAAPRSGEAAWIVAKLVHAPGSRRSKRAK